MWDPGPVNEVSRGLTLEPVEHKTETVTLLIQNRPTSEYYVWEPKLLYDPKLVPPSCLNFVGCAIRV